MVIEPNLKPAIMRLESGQRLKRRKSMSRRSGQNGYFSRKGNQWHVRFYIDVPGQEKRKRLSIPVCPISGPGKKTLPERIRRAKEIINASGANSEEHFNRVEAANLGLTFGQQAERCLKESQSRKRKPVKPKTVCCWRSIIKVWLEDLGPMPLASVDNLAMKELVSKLHKAGQSPNSIRNVTNVVKMVVASAKNEQGEELFHRKWNHEFIDMPLIVREELNTPTFSAEEVSRIVAEPGKYKMLYILLAATGMRIGEAMALPVSRVVDNCTPSRSSTPIGRDSSVPPSTTQNVTSTYLKRLRPRSASILAGARTGMYSKRIPDARTASTT